MASQVVYATVGELKSQPGITGSDDDVFLTLALSAASRVIDNYCGRDEDGFVASNTPTARVYVGSGEVYQWIDESPEISMVEMKSSVTVDTYDLTLSIDDWIPFVGSPQHPNFNKAPWYALMLNRPSGFTIFTAGVGYTNFIGWPRRDYPQFDEQWPRIPTVKVTAKWGYGLDTPPDAIKMATIAQAARGVKRGQSFWADAAASSDFSQLMFVKKIDPDIELMLKYGGFVRVNYSRLT